MTLKRKIALGVSLIVLFFLLSLHLAKPMYFGTNKDELDEIEKKFFLSDPNKVYTEQLKFRDTAIKEYQDNLSAFENAMVDTLLTSNRLRNIGINYLLPQTKTYFKIPLNNYTYAKEYLLVGYDTLYIEYAIDVDKISTILSSSKISPQEFINVLRYQDYIKINKNATYHVRKVGVVIYISILIFLFYLFNFSLTNYELEPDDKKLLTRSVFDWIKKRTKNAKYMEGSVEKDEKFRQHYLNRLSDIEKSLDEFEKRNKAYFILENMVSKSEAKSREVHGRANLMLVSGLIMAFVGVVVFYYTLPSNIKTSDITEILVLSIRPTLMLLFIESVAWYLVKQHKSLLNDYKYYHTIYNKKIGYLAAFQLTSEGQASDENTKSVIPIMILSEEIKNLESGKDGEVGVETSNDLLTSLFDKLLNKF